MTQMAGKSSDNVQDVRNLSRSRSASTLTSAVGPLLVMAVKLPGVLPRFRMLIPAIKSQRPGLAPLPQHSPAFPMTYFEKATFSLHNSGL